MHRECIFYRQNQKRGHYIVRQLLDFFCHHSTSNTVASDYKVSIVSLIRSIISMWSLLLQDKYLTKSSPFRLIIP